MKENGYKSTTDKENGIEKEKAGYREQVNEKLVFLYIKYGRTTGKEVDKLPVWGT